MVADGKESTFISYGFQSPRIEEVKQFAESYREARTRDDASDRLQQNTTHHGGTGTFDTYCSMLSGGLTCKDAKVQSEYALFYLAGEKYFLTYRGAVDHSDY